MVPKYIILIFGLLCTTLITSAQDSTVDQETTDSSLKKSTESKESEETKDREISNNDFLTCGLRNLRGGSSSTSNEAFQATKFGELPWIVAMSEEIEPEVFSFACTGALINANAVVSTAHCVHKFVKSPKSLIISAGVWNSTITADDTTIQKQYAKKIVILEHFDKSFHMNDIAVILLESSLDLSHDHVQPICLPSVTESFNMRNCLLNYWSIENDKLSLRKAELLVVPGKQCAIKLKDHGEIHDLPLHESVICASSEKNDGDCDEQIGAPLICPIAGEKDRYYLAGLASIGYGCTSDDYIGIFVNVAILRRWIMSVAN